MFIETEHKIEVALYDGLGRMVKEASFIPGKYNVDLTGLSNGIYLLRIIGGVEKQPIRIVKIQ